MRPYHNKLSESKVPGFRREEHTQGSLERLSTLFDLGLNCVCSSSLKDLKEVAEESFREFSQGNSKAVRSQVIRDLGKGEEERVEYFRGEGERGNLWLAQSYYWGNNELQHYTARLANAWVTLGYIKSLLFKLFGIGLCKA